MEFVTSLLLLISAILLSVIAVKGLLRKPVDQESKPAIDLPLPAVGEPGSASGPRR